MLTLRTIGDASAACGRGDFWSNHMGSGENLLEKFAGVAGDATVDNQADGVINNVLDSVASHIPGGEAVEGIVKTGVDQAANTAINDELGKLFGGDKPQQ